MSFTFTWNNPATISWNVIDENEQPVLGAVVKASLYTGRSEDHPDQTPGTAITAMANLTLAEVGGGLYQSADIPASSIPAPEGDYILVIDATLNTIPIGHWEEPASVVSPSVRGRLSLCTIDDLKQHLGIDPADVSQDSWLNRLILAASNDFLTSIRRPRAFVAMDHKETIEVKNWQSEQHMEDVFLKHYPINAIASVTINGTAMVPFDETNPAVPGYFFDTQLDPEERQKITLMGFYYPIFGTWSSPWRSIYRPPAARVIVGYNAGYEEIPPDVSQAVIELVAFKRGMSQLQRKDQTTEWLQLGQFQGHISTAATTLKINSICMPDSVAAVIAKYQRPIIG